MTVNRKRFRIEQAILGDTSVSACRRRRRNESMHREIMAELRDVRTQMAGGGQARAAVTESTEASVARKVHEPQVLLETYQAQIEQCEKLKVELDPDSRRHQPHQAGDRDAARQEL